MDYRGLTKQEKPPKGQGGGMGDEWLNRMDASGYELAALEGYGGGGSVYLMAVVRRKQH